MPCLYGYSGDYAGAYRSLEKELSDVFPSLERWSNDDSALAAFAYSDLRATHHAPGRIVAVHGERGAYPSPDAAERFETQARLIADGDLSTLSAATFVTHDIDSRRMSLASGWLSPFPLYYRADHRGVIFSSHLKPLARALAAPSDHVGIAEFLRQNWCFAGRTLFAGIRRLLPGQLLRIDPRHLPALSETSELWRANETGEESSSESIWERLVSSCASGVPDGPVGLMLSAGWDSRVLLGALATAFGKSQVITTTHGEPTNRELKLARRLSEIGASDHAEIALGPTSLGTPDVLDRLFRDGEALLYPFWYLGPAALSSRAPHTFFSGILGEVLGGHYSVTGPASARGQQLLTQTVMRGDAGQSASGADALRNAAAYTSRRRSLWYLTPALAAAVGADADAAIASDIDATIERFKSRGITAANRSVEAYITEHRGLMMVASQALIAHTVSPVSMPFSDAVLTQMIGSVPMHRRIHNRLSRSLLHRYHPELLKVPLAATLVRADRPLVVQEGGRVVRHVMDNVTDAVFSATGGRLGRSRPSGWMDFERVVRLGGWLDGVTDSLDPAVFDIGAIRKRVDEIKAYRGHIKLGHPFLKMAYLDRMLRA